MDKSPIASSSISSIPSQSSSSNTSNAPVPSVETNAFTATPLDTSNPSEIASTDSDLRYLGYLGRIRALATAGSRYLAYTSDFGEAFRPVVGRRIVQTTYGISWAYVTLDVAYEGYKEHQKGSEGVEVARTVLERSIFQSLASMALPAFTIHSTVHAADVLFKRYGRFQKWGPTITGLAVIPLLPYMFDHPVEYVVQKGFDTFWPTKHHHGQNEGLDSHTPTNNNEDPAPLPTVPTSTTPSPKSAIGSIISSVSDAASSHSLEKKRN